MPARDATLCKNDKTVTRSLSKEDTHKATAERRALAGQDRREENNGLGKNDTGQNRTVRQPSPSRAFSAVHYASRVAPHTVCAAEEHRGAGNARVGLGCGRRTSLAPLLSSMLNSVVSALRPLRHHLAIKPVGRCKELGSLMEPSQWSVFHARTACVQIIHTVTRLH